MTERIDLVLAPRPAQRPRARRLAIALLCVSLAAGPGVQAQTPAPAPQKAAKNRFEGEPVTLNFVNAEIEGVTRAVGAILKKQFIVDPRVRGTITLYSDQPLTPREVYLNYLAALRGLGFTVVEVGGMFKVVPEADAKLQTGTVAVESSGRHGDQVLTQIFHLNHENANNLVAVLRPLISPNNTINASPGTNSLVITDYADNLQRIAKIIAAMDVPAGSDVEVIPLQNAVAADLAVIVQRLSAASAMPGVPQSAGTPLIMVDPRSNSLIVRAPNPSRMALIRSLVAKLDLPAASNNGKGNIWVVYLKNADAVKLAAVLRAAFGSQGGSGAAASATPRPASRAANAPGADQSDALGGATPSTAPVSASAEPSTGGFIQADPATNSLIITAAEPLYRQLRNVIDKLDSRRAQVYIESLIVKVDAEKMADIGIQWQAISGDQNSSRIVGGGTNYGNPNIVNLTTAINEGLTGLAGVAIPPGLNIGVLKKIGDFWNIGALARFLETKTDANVLATPNMVSLDNEEAKIVVGQNVPFLTGSYSNTGGNGAINPFQTIERKDVGLTLRIKPQIGEGGTIRLVIYQENSTVVPSSRNSPQGLTTDKSAIETTVVVDDGQIMVLGGLLKDEYGGSVEQVPFLGDLPILGPLFRTDNRTRTKSNLMVFLRPMVIRNQDDSNRLTMDRYDLMRATQQTAGQPRQSVVMPINDAPVTAPLPAPEPGSPFKGGLVPPPLSMESAPARAASAPAAQAQTSNGPPPPSRGPVGPQQLQMP